ncbi:MAG: 3'(2'),5'-bisphosphate nucleotidase CysQ [Desulfatirhabdiaceae bacterium]
MQIDHINMDFLGLLAVEAGKAVLEIYDTDFTVDYKADESPLTQADTRSHRIITHGLTERYPDIPILSEEGKSIPYEVRKTWHQFWLVDPLDGTKEFIRKNGEFTINIALIEDNQPVLGVIYVPVLDLLFLGNVRRGCTRDFRGVKTTLKMVAWKPQSKIRVVHSRSHQSPDMDTLLNRLPAYSCISRGSSLKFCAVAAGEADFYPRLGPTSEWDTAAGHAIIMAAGGVVVDMQGNHLCYNKESLLNSAFLVAHGIDFLKQIGVLPASDA